MAVKLYKGSIFDISADVIVNPANSFLWNGAGLAGLIEKRATKRMTGYYAGKPSEVKFLAREAAIKQYLEEKSATKLIPYGGAVTTSPGALYESYKAIIHVVGPIWGGGTHLETKLLTLAYSEALARMGEGGHQSAAMPAVSAGIFGVPIHIVATCAAKAIRSWWWNEFDVTFALMETEHLLAFQYHFPNAKVI